jgi:hypothetical protein
MPELSTVRLVSILTTAGITFSATLTNGLAGVSPPETARVASASVFDRGAGAAL